MPLLKVTIDGQETLLRALGVVEKSVHDWRPAWEECEKLFYEIEGNQFASQGSRGGNPWVKLSEGYGKWKALHHPGKPLLVVDGTLRDSLQGKGDGAIRDIQPDSLTLGSSIPYAAYHQRGTSRMPARPPMVITPSDLGQFTRRLLKHMETAGTVAGFGVKRANA